MKCLFQIFRRRHNDKRTVSTFATRDRRSISGFASSQQNTSRGNSKGAVVHNQIEMDSHADTIVCGANCAILHYTGRECDVSPYTDAYAAIKSVPIVQAATAYDDPKTATTTILVFNEAIWMGDKMDHTLVNPNQLRSFGVTIQDNPFAELPTFLSTEGNEFVMPLSCKGTIIGAPTRTPTDCELNTCPHVILSSDHEWNPQNLQLPQATCSVEEAVYRSVASTLIHRGRDGHESGVLFSIGGVLKRAIESVNVFAVRRETSVAEIQFQDLPQLKTFQSTGRHSSTTPEELSERWQIGLAQAKETLKRTSQRLLRSAVMPLARRYRADRMFSLK